MDELIQIHDKGTEYRTVSGRELHKALQVKTPYTIWFKRMCKYGFTEGKDYTLKNEYVLSDKRNRSYKQTNHILTISMAKELCMIQRTETGKKFRQYFIAAEESWNSPDEIMDRALAIARERVKNFQESIYKQIKVCCDEDYD